MKTCTAKDIDAILPQTQCGLCGYGGCMPYAKAMSDDKAPIDLCPPGGVETLEALAILLKQDATPYLESMKVKTKPPAQAVIREAECIGCTKCISACPVDAIIGAAKSMHVVLSDYCTGCELCISPCPVDCIDMVPIKKLDKENEQQGRDHSRARFQRREQRLQKIQDIENNSGKQLLVEERKTSLQSYIAAALNRTKNSG